MTEEEILQNMAGANILSKNYDYVSVRVLVVHVKKKMLGFHTETELGTGAIIPDKKEQSWELFGKIKKLMQEYGHTFELEKK